MKKWNFKSWRIGDYLRQFSIVTAGIVVTFIGSNLVSNYSTNKDIRSTMHLIIKELENNKNDLILIDRKHDGDRIIAQHLINNKFDVRKIDEDTLIKYINFVSQLSSFSYSTDALDVLKGSSLMQKIDDKDLLLRVIKAYQGLQNVQESVSEYYSLKRMVILPAALNSEQNERDDIYSSYEMALSSQPMRNFCMITIGFFDPDYLEQKIIQIDSLLIRLKSTY